MQDLSRQVLGAELPTRAPDPSASAERTRDGGRDVRPRSEAAKRHGEAMLASADRTRALREKTAETATTIAQIGSSAVRVTTAAHTAEFGPSGLEFMPHDRRGIGIASSRFGYQLASVARGDQTVWSGGMVAPVVSGNQVRYERAPGLVEHYLALDRGVEQMFSLPEIPAGTGDLVFRARIDTSLEGTATEAGGLHFKRDGEPGVVFGRAIAYDGLGRTTPADLVLAGDVLELRVPGEWLDHAQGPLLVDPLIGSDINLTFFVYDEEWVDIAYNRLNNEFVIAFINGGTDLVVSRLDGNGVVQQGGVILDNNADAKARPAIAWSEPTENKYLIAYQRLDDIYVVVIDRTLSITTAVARVYDPVGAEVQANAGVAYDASRNSWLVVWDDSSQSASQDILGERVLTSGAQQGTVILRNLTAVLGDPAISYSDTTDRFLLAFNSGTDLAGCTIDGPVSSILATVTISSMTNTQEKAQIAWNSTSNEWLVVFETDNFGDEDVLGRRVSTSAALVGSLVLSGNSSEEEQDPDVAYLPSSNTYLIGYDRLDATDTEWNVWAREHNADGSAASSSFQASSSPTSTSDEFFTTIAANTVQEEWLQAWEDWRAATDADVWGQRYASDKTAPKVVRFNPQDDATGVTLDRAIFVDFSQDMNASTVNGTNIRVYQAGVTEITTKTVTYLSGTRQAKVTVAGSWPTNQTIRVNVGASVANTLAVTLGAAVEATFTTGSSLSLPDTDGDGLLDSEETSLGTLTNDADTDNDGLTDYEEVFETFTNPTEDDTDGDGTLDGSDASPNGTPTSPTNVPDPVPTASFVVTAMHPQGTFGSKANVPADVQLAVTFNSPVDTTSITGSNLTLFDHTTSASVTLSFGSQPTPQTIVMVPAIALVNGRTYELTVTSGPTAIKDTAGQRVSTGGAGVFLVSAPTDGGFEARHYGSTLEQTEWEVFPTPGPTMGQAKVIPSTRKLQLNETDVLTPGRAIAVELTRTYRNNANAASGIFGNNWHFTYDRGFETIADTNGDGRRELRFRTEDGRQFTYLSGASTLASAYQKPVGFFETTKKLTISGKALLVTRDIHGLEHFYEFHTGTSTTVDDPDALPANSKGFLVRIRDRNHNTVVVNRFAANHATRPNAIDTIVDDLDRTTTFTYSATVGQENLCTKVEQFVGLGSPRSWLYTYNANRSLIKVETPPSDFQLPNGSIATNTRKAQEYTYSTLGGTYLLTSIEDARENVSFRAVYDGLGDVLQIDYGSGVDVGTAVFSYRLNTTLGMNRATQVDRNGNVHELTHQDFTINSTWLIASSSVYTRGLHPNLPSGETAGFTWNYVHDSRGLIVEAVSPRGTVERTIRCSSCGCPLQSVEKFATYNELQISASAGVENDVVTEIVYDPHFHQPIRVIEPRGNNAAFVGTSANIVASVEVVGTQTPRSYTNVDAVKRDSYTTFLYYDHENIANRLTADTTAIGNTVFLERDLPRTHGRPTTGAYKDPPNTATFGDNDADGFADRGGNLYALRGPQPRVLDTTTGAFLASRQLIECGYTYNQYGQRIMEIEADGQRNRLKWNVGTFNISTNPERGFLHHVVYSTSYTDADLSLTDGTIASGPSGTGLELVTELTHDVFGNRLTSRNPRGHLSTRVVNALNLATKKTAPSPFSYEREFVYDGNDNLVEERIQNVVPNDVNDNGIQDSGEQQEVAGHGDFVNTFSYNSANKLIRKDVDAFGSSPATLTTVFAYDAKQLRISAREPDGNVHVVRYDERDLMYQSVRGASDTLTSTTTSYDYDPDGQLLQILDDDGNTVPQTTITYDTLHRPTSWTTEFGNKLELTYDVAGFARQRVNRGQARGDPGDVFTTVLSNELFEFDEAGREFQKSTELFDAVETLATQGLTRMTPPIDLSAKRLRSGELVSQTVAYDPDGKALTTFDDYGRRVWFAYDAADRVQEAKDELGSRRQYAHDANGNVVRVTEIEVSDDGLVTETFYSEAFYDQLNRTFAMVTHLGATRRALYDSRNNLVQTSDAMGTIGVLEIDDLPTASEHGTFPQFTATTPAATTIINGRGNTTRTTYDGASRPLTLTRDLRQDGTGGSIVVGQIVTQQNWTGNGLVTSRTDPNGNTTSYVYDHQDRLVGEMFGDATFAHTTYLRSGVIKTVRDPRNVVKTFTYDVDERAIAVAFTNVPPGEGQTTFESSRYDGLNRQTRIEDNDSIVELSYDSMARTVQDKQRISTGTPRTSSAQALAGEVQGTTKRVFDGIGSVLKQIYPSTTTFTRAYDGIDRLATVKAGATTLASFSHIGMADRRRSRSYPVPSITQSLTYDADRRVTRLDAIRTATNQRIRGFTYAWDRENNRRFERRLTVNTNLSEVGGLGEFYRYDSAYRLIHDDRDVASSALDLVASSATTVTSPTIDVTKATDFNLDAAGNRRQTTIDAATQTYQLDGGAQVGDLAMNQYTRIGATYQTHDLAGNSLSSSELGLQRFFDATNRLVQYTQGSKDIRYRYDALGRRTLKQDVGGSFATALYFYDGWHDVEESTTGGVVTRRYVFGENTDEPIRATIPDAADVDGDGNIAELVDLYYHQNSLGSVVALTTAAGAVAESYRYSSFGTPTIFDKNGVQVSSTQVKQPFMFTGRRWDFEEASGLYYFRFRFYDPAVGRFVSRDPMGLWGDEGQKGVGQSYCANNPVNYVDPFGLTSPSPRGDPGFGKGLRDGFYEGAEGLAGLPETLSDLWEALTSGQCIDNLDLDTLSNVLAGFLAGLGEALVSKFPPALVAYVLAKIAIYFYGNWWCHDFWYQMGKDIGAMIIEVFVGFVGGKMVGGVLDGLKTFIRKRRGGGHGRPENPDTTKDDGSPGTDECFIAGTLVVLACGLMPIEAVKSGDLVLSRNDTTGEVAYRRVVKVVRGYTENVCRVAYRVTKTEASDKTRSSDADAKADEADGAIVCTPSHRIFRLDDNEWVKAKDLRPGDRLLSDDGDPVEVVSVEMAPRLAYTWNLEVEENHTYFVAGSTGSEQILVHNGQPDRWRITDDEGQEIIDDIHESEAGHDPTGKRRKNRTSTLSEGVDGEYDLTNSDRLTPRQRERARGWFGDKVHIQDGDGRELDRDDVVDPDKKNHGEPRGITAAEERTGEPPPRQWSSCGACHGGRACASCAELQKRKGVHNPTGDDPDSCHKVLP